jgi:hypothetical protein
MTGYAALPVGKLCCPWGSLVARGEALGAPGDAPSFPFEMDVLPATDTAFGLTFVVEIA